MSKVIDKLSKSVDHSNQSLITPKTIGFLRTKSGNAFHYVLEKLQSSVKKIRKPFSRKGKKTTEEEEDEKNNLPVRRQLKLD